MRHAHKSFKNWIIREIRVQNNELLEVSFMQLTVLFPAPDGVELAAGDGVGEGVVGLHIFIGGDGLGPLGQDPDWLKFFDSVRPLIFLKSS